MNKRMTIKQSIISVIVIAIAVFISMQIANGSEDNQTDWKPVNFSNYSGWCNSNNTQVCDETLKEFKESIRDAFTE